MRTEIEPQMHTDEHGFGLQLQRIWILASPIRSIRGDRWLMFVSKQLDVAEGADASKNAVCYTLSASTFLLGIPPNDVRDACAEVVKLADTPS